jgi:ribosome maturation factor RimP
MTTSTVSKPQPHRDELLALVEPVCVDAGYELVDLEFRGNILRVYIDFPAGDERSISFDDCTKLSHELSAILDVEDPIVETYSLEVSSPGIDRPLRKPEHFRRHLGQVAKLTLHNGVGGRRNFKGVLVAVSGSDADSASDSNSSVTLEVDGTQYDVPLADLSSAKLVPDWNALMKGQGKRARGLV